MFKSSNQQVVEGRFINTTLLVVQDVPSPPGRPIIITVGSRSVTVRWQASLQENNSPIVSYLARIKSVEGNRPTKEMVVLPKDIGSATIHGVQPYTAYRVSAFAINAIGSSLQSDDSEIFFTLQEAPESAPQNLKATSNHSSRIHLSWQPPPADKIHGELKHYEIAYRRSGSNQEQVITTENPQKSEITIYGLMPYREYEVFVSALNSEGKGPAATARVVTAEGIPGKPKMIHTTTSPMSTSFYVNWLAPEVINGNIVRYELEWKHGNLTRTKSIQQHLTNPMSAYISDLAPFTQYQVRVRAVTNGGQGDYSDVYPVHTDVAGPGPPIINNFTVLGSHSIYLQWEEPFLFYKNIDSYFIQVTDLASYKQHTRPLYDTSTETIVTGLPSNKEYKVKIAAVTKSLYSNMQYIGVFSKEYNFELIGQPDSNVNFTVADPAAVEKAEQEVESAGIIAGVICGILLIVIVTLVAIGCRSLTCRKYYQAAYNYLAVPTNSNSPPSTSIVVVVDQPEEPVYPAISVGDFLQHVKALHADSDVGFSHEFDDINKRTSVVIKQDASNLPENKSKNRYVNITAYDHSRVLLEKSLQPRQKQSDYINANYVDGYRKPKAYIATQGPLPQTFADFWRMIWEQNSVVIVMITKLMERGRRKCDQYWPDEGVETYGAIQVKHVNTFSRAHYTVRIFSLKNIKLKKQFSERIVHQFHYTEWPDHGVPDFTLPVLKFVQKSAMLNPSKAGPIVVHCSAGVGRTGTYILIDSMIAQINTEGTINIPEFLLNIRKQRNYLVQTEEQYMLIHDALAEYLMCPNSEVKGGELSKYIEKLSESSGDNGSTVLQNQYQLIMAFKPKSADQSFATKSSTECKNRSLEYLPLWPKRVSLPMKPGVEGSEYINASYLQGYNKTDEFIVTQHPLDSTIEDFWRMVWDKNSSLIVLLSQDEGEDYPQFWPDEERPISVDTGIFKLTFREDSPGADYSVKDFLLESTQDDYVLMTRIVSCSDWLNPESPAHKSFDFIENVKEIHARNEIGPVIVVDRYGGVDGAKFCALWTLYDQLQHDHTIDVYHLCKLYHNKRPNIIGSLEDYMFLYSALDSYEHEQNEKESASLSHHFHLRSSAKRNGTMPRSPTLPVHNNTDTVVTPQNKTLPAKIETDV
ncbi:hypothetical protein FSP39_006244 [Pinctada imbricata]|uniref:Protein-tyrosine-phosphatase n=1 Tax=Pinctada imbricata TaxID=66713 RepID=A0AA89C5D6_PINIB|nr:hypothetical protein FSP39_006244 [Pinctada imbricata]